MNSQNSQLSTHLSEESINDMILGMPSAEDRRHLATCELCRSRLEESQIQLHASLDLFNQASLAWSESKATPLPRHAFHQRARFFTPRPLAWSSAAAAFLLAAVVSWNYQHRPALPTSPVSAVTNSYAAQIDEDNQLLRNVYTALNDEPASPLSEYAVDTGSGSNGASTKAKTQ
jgi:hypothetical protein